MAMTPMAWSAFLFSSPGQKPRPTLTSSSVSNFVLLVEGADDAGPGLTTSTFWRVLDVAGGDGAFLVDGKRAEFANLVMWP